MKSAPRRASWPNGSKCTASGAVPETNIFPTCATGNCISRTPNCSVTHAAQDLAGGQGSTSMATSLAQHGWNEAQAKNADANAPNLTPICATSPNICRPKKRLDHFLDLHLVGIRCHIIPLGCSLIGGALKPPMLNFSLEGRLLLVACQPRGTSQEIGRCYSCNNTTAPRATAFATASTSQLVRRMQPCDCVLAMLAGSGVPWMP